MELKENLNSNNVVENGTIKVDKIYDLVKDNDKINCIRDFYSVISDIYSTSVYQLTEKQQLKKEINLNEMIKLIQIGLTNFVELVHYDNLITIDKKLYNNTIKKVNYNLENDISFNYCSSVLNDNNKKQYYLVKELANKLFNSKNFKRLYTIDLTNYVNDIENKYYIVFNHKEFINYIIDNYKSL